MGIWWADMKSKGGKNMARTLIRIDRNGTKYWADDTCRRCGGAGERSEWYYTGMVCYECGGTGHSTPRLEKEYTPEYAAKLEGRRAEREARKLGYASADAMREAREREAERLEAERREREEREAVARRAEEERIRAEKARSQYVGTVGEELKITAVYEGSPYFERRSFSGYGTERCYIHRFRDESGNLIIWKSCSGFPILGCNEGETVVVNGKVKEHSEYKDEKQTIITRAKVKRPA